jgi:integrase
MSALTKSQPDRTGNALKNPGVCENTREATLNPASHREDLSAMAKRRFQDPRPEKLGRAWYIRAWKDFYVGGVRTRKRVRIKLADASKGLREVQKLAAAELRKLNSGIVQVGAGVNVMHYVETEYRTKYLPRLRKPVRDCYESVIKVHLEPMFGSGSLADLTRSNLQGYFANRAGGVEYPTLLKIRDTLSSILRSAVHGELLEKNPMDGIQIPNDKRPRRPKPVLTPLQFHQLLEVMPEPYSTMVATCVWAGLRASEVIGLKWRDIQTDAIVISQRYCRGDWDIPKTDASAAPIAVEPELIARIERLKSLETAVRAGRAIRRFKLVKCSGPDDLVFQSVKDGKPMRDNNVLRRFIKPAARQLGIAVCNWQALRRSCATWMVQSGGDIKSVQGQMRHTRASTTLDIYSQIEPTGQRRAAQRLSEFVKQQTAEKTLSQMVQ